ncbi:SigE family RNA polymerase sigma factor [Kineococcus glutinatus]|uniref:SigE family RNA polymerase sigma factor n=1 Tax=Kineococcus glutinatus TaxID=1070872 RepID=A0ABP9HGW3_9ACTN
MSRDEGFSDWAIATTPQLLRLGRLLAGDGHSSEDLVQDVLERVYVKWSRIENPTAYARQALAHASMSYWRLRGRRREVNLDVVAEPAGSTRHITAVDDRSEAMSLLRQLPARQRAVLALRYLDDCSEQEIADILGVSVGTVKSHGARALTRLRQLDTHLTGPAQASRRSPDITRLIHRPEDSTP